MEIDIESSLQKSLELLKSNSLDAALDSLWPIEKESRNAANLPSLSRILVHMIELCHMSGNWPELNTTITTLSKKRGQLKQAIVLMVQKAIEYVEAQNDMEKKMELIFTLRMITLGKIFVEVERAKLTKILCGIYENRGQLKDAADVLFELQVESFGSMDNKEKIDYLLEQMRLGIATKDYARTQIISRKMNIKHFDSDDMDSRKLLFYRMKIEVSLHDYEYLLCANHYQQIYQTKSVKEDTTQSLDALLNIVLYTVLAPYDNEQSNLMHILTSDKLLDQLPAYKALLNCFVSKELMRWPKLLSAFKETLSETQLFSNKSEDSVVRWQQLKDRVVEHNIRIIAKYYNNISISRLTVLLDTTTQEAEEALSKLVVSKTIFARFDRPSGIVSFVSRVNPEETMNEWARKVGTALDHVVKINHLIAKEEMLHQLSLVKN